MTTPIPVELTVLAHGGQPISELDDIETLMRLYKPKVFVLWLFRWEIATR
jgi:hypothetical protein